jgi:hypothetical protein
MLSLYAKSALFYDTRAFPLVTLLSSLSVINFQKFIFFIDYVFIR